MRAVPILWAIHGMLLQDRNENSYNYAIIMYINLIVTLSSLCLHKTNQAKQFKMSEASMSEEMKTLLRWQKELEELIIEADSRIHEQEESYLLEAPNGNVVRGWDNFVDSKLGTAARRHIRNSDRIFSSSSYSCFRRCNE